MLSQNEPSKPSPQVHEQCYCISKCIGQINNDTRLLPFALQYAAWLYNYTPKSNNLAPIEIFTCQRTNCEFLRCAKVFGCPVYVLEPRLQDGNKIPKWEPRPRQAQFLGFSKEHSSLSALVRNLRTSAITPQFHFVTDQRFETVMGGLNPSLKFDLTDPENIGTFLKTHWDTDDRDHALEHWDPEIDGDMPPLVPEWDTHPIDGQDLPVNPDLRGPHSLPPRVRFQEPNDTQQRQHEPAAPAAPPPVIILPPTTQDPAPQRAPTLTVDTDIPADSPHPPSAPRGRPHFFDDDNAQPGCATEEPPPILRSLQQGEQRSGRPKRVTKPPDRLTFEELGEPRVRYHSKPSA
jgi:hypothetical protein